MKYCSHCGSANLTLRTPSDDNRPRIICSDCQTVHYQNPKIVVGCLAFWEGKILLCRRAIEPRRGLWNLPAGFMENTEATDVGAAREVLEESGAVVDILRLHSVYSVLHANQVYMIFLANLQKPIFTEAPETLESRLFAIDEIPWDELAFNSNHFALRRYTANPDFTGVHLGDSFSFKAM
jgi:ADP-ribose pyrophosphatase YjhB (NUDIX family)